MVNETDYFTSNDFQLLKKKAKEFILRFYN